MPNKIFYTKLYAFQDELLEIVRAQNVEFYLTGGTVLSRAYLNHRYSDDLDFFVNQAGDCTNGHKSHEIQQQAGADNQIEVFGYFSIL